jgi:hypothetical protein
MCSAYGRAAPRLTVTSDETFTFRGARAISARAQSRRRLVSPRIAALSGRT